MRLDTGMEGWRKEQWRTESRYLSASIVMVQNRTHHLEHNLRCAFKPGLSCYSFSVFCHPSCLKCVFWRISGRTGPPRRAAPADTPRKPVWPLWEGKRCCERVSGFQESLTLTERVEADTLMWLLSKTCWCWTWELSQLQVSHTKQ